MPPRANPRPAGPNRRRSGPYLPGSFILMLIFVALIVALFMNNPLGDGQTDQIQPPPESLRTA